MRLLQIIGFVALGAVGVVHIGYATLFLRSMRRNPTMEHLTALLYEWQTQTGAAFALCAALASVLVIADQTRSIRQHEEQRREREEKQHERKVEALRALLPFTLLELFDYAKQSAHATAALLVEDQHGCIVHKGKPCPQLPGGLADQMTRPIQEIGSDYARPLIIVVTQLQIHHSRLQETMRPSDPTWPLTRHNVLGRIVDSAEICARIGAIFPYARGETQEPPPPISADHVKNILIIMSMEPRYDSDLHSEIDRRTNSGAWPAH